MFDEIDTDHNGSIDFKEFCEISKKTIEGKMKKTFEEIDANHDGNISFEEMMAHFKDECKECCPDKCKILFDEFDADHNGIIDFKEFCDMTKKMMS